MQLFNFRTIPALVLAMITVLGVRASGQEPRGSQPVLGLAGPVRGTGALNALGGLLPHVAAQHGLSPQALQNTLLRNRDLWLDPQGQLFYSCTGGPRAVPARPRQRGGVTAAAAPFPTTETFRLHSRPASRKKIYLDFDGHVTTGTQWNTSYGLATINSAGWDLDGSPTTWGAAEHEGIQITWQRMAEDFAPFDVDVTTEDPGVDALRRIGPSDQDYGIRVIQSPTAWMPDSAGVLGVAYLTSFNWDSDTPCFSFTAASNNDIKEFAETGSHEVGHALGLRHDGTTAGVEYFGGHGNWAPIMGGGNREITQWSKGEYANANNVEDDIAVMGNYGAAIAADDAADTTATATALSGTSPVVNGIIQRSTDLDVYSFNTGNGPVSLRANMASVGCNMHIRMDLLNSSGTTLATTNVTTPQSTLSANLQPGKYFVRVEGIGSGNPLTDGFSKYGSLGQYRLSLTLQQSVIAPSALTATASSQNAIALSWQDNSSNETAFEIQVAEPNGSFTLLNSVAANVTSYVHQGLAASTTRQYRVRGVAGSLLSDWSNTATESTFPPPPTAPGALTATAVSGNQVDLQWADRSSNESGFQVERKTGTAEFALITTTAANATSYQDTSAQPGTTYTYQVRATNRGGNSDYAGPASATTPHVAPAPPVLESATPNRAGQVRLTWRLGEGVNTGVRLERKSGTGSYEPVADVAVGTTFHVDPDRAPNVHYTYRLLAYGPGGESAWAPTLNALTFPATPTELTAAMSGTNAVLNWKQVGGAAGYRVEVKVGADPTFVEVADAGVNATSYVHTGRASGLTFTYRVKAWNATGESTYSPTATVSTVPPLNTLTVAPTSVKGGGSSKGTITLQTPALAGGAVIKLTGNATLVTLPATVTIKAGAKSATFTIKTKRVRSNQTTAITAEYGGRTLTANLTVKK